MILPRSSPTPVSLLLHSTPSVYHFIIHPLSLTHNQSFFPQWVVHVTSLHFQASRVPSIKSSQLRPEGEARTPISYSQTETGLSDFTASFLETNNVRRTDSADWLTDIAESVRRAPKSDGQWITAAVPFRCTFHFLCNYSFLTINNKQ